MTGRENVYLSGHYWGYLSGTDQRMPDIIAFSELEQFSPPVKHYSSGMYLRLGFAIGIHVNPDILLVDEILAVGDQRFQKMQGTYSPVASERKTILFVSMIWIPSLQSATVLW